MFNLSDIDSLNFIPRVQLVLVDYIIFFLLIGISVGIGLWIGFKEWKTADTKDYLIGGRTMHPIPVALSLIGGVISAMSVLGNATETYMFGTQLWLNLLGCIWGTVFVAYLMLPILYPLEMVSIMEYMILRFQSQTLKKLGSIVQIAALLLFIGICLYIPSIALSSMTNLSYWLAIIILGVVCAIYVSLGGMKAVVYTDVLQTSLMFIGIIAVVTIASIDVGGITKVFEIANDGGRLEFFNMDMNPTTRHTFWSVQVLGFYFIIRNNGAGQAQFQRFTSVRTLKISQGLCLIFLIGVAILWSMFYLTGLVAYATYFDCDPLKNNQIEKEDQIVPFLVADKLSGLPGMSGLFVSAVYGAVLSSLSSCASAISALLWEDFLSEWKWFRSSINISPINVTRSISALSLFLGIGVAFLIGTLGTLFQAMNSLLAAIVSPMDGVFVTAILAPWVTEKGAICGFLTAVVFNMWLLIGKFANDAGTAISLPMSTDGCLLNSTHSGISSESLLSEMDLENELFTSQPQLLRAQNLDQVLERDYLLMYDISYCYYGVMGILIVFTVSSLVSLVTGPTDPHGLEEHLVNRFIFRLYTKLWDRYSLKKQPNNEMRLSEKNADLSVKFADMNTKF